MINTKIIEDVEGRGNLVAVIVQEPEGMKLIQYAKSGEVLFVSRAFNNFRMSEHKQGRVYDDICSTD